MQNKQAVTSIYNINFADIKGAQVNLEKYRGKKIMIVNVASECGYTPQYSGLQQLQNEYENSLVVLGFPCNDFGGQEPGSDSEILSFCSTRFDVKFPVFSKIIIKGKEIHPLYKWLSSPADNGWNSQLPEWNFCKYLLDEKGNLIGYFSQHINPLDEEILKLLK